tara:strand:+ start:170 stop:346 length:177 start_codon:yes stop_codon:yes gene_type:complete
MIFIVPYFQPLKFSSSIKVIIDAVKCAFWVFTVLVGALANAALLLIERKKSSTFHCFS